MTMISLMEDDSLRSPWFASQFLRARSKRRSIRRAAAVPRMIPSKQGKFLADVFEIVGQLMLDKDDMVQKGYGWLLKEVSRLHQKEAPNYVVSRRSARWLTICALGFL